MKLLLRSKPSRNPNSSYFRKVQLFLVDIIEFLCYYNYKFNINGVE